MESYEDYEYESPVGVIYIKSLSKVIGIIICVILLIVAIFSSWYTLDENQDAIITTFGKPELVSESGLHFKIPFIQKTHKVNTSVQGMPIGYTQDEKEFVENESLMITKDFNFISVDFYVEWQIADALKYWYSSEDAETILKTLAMSYIRDTIGSYNVDEVLTTGKVQIQTEIKDKLVARVEDEDLGIVIKSVAIQDAAPPTAEVSAAFKAVEDAKQKADEVVNNAKAYQSQQIPSAEAKSNQIQENAEAKKQARINEANGQIARFNSMYEEYIKFPGITKERMYYETMEKLLPDIRVIIKDNNGDMVNILGGIN